MLFIGTSNAADGPDGEKDCKAKYKKTVLFGCLKKN